MHTEEWEDIVVADRFRELLKTRDYIIFDGAMGTMLQAAGMKMGETPEVLNITRPELLVSIAEQYYNAGSDVVYANTFGANRYKLEECGKSVEELVTAGIVNAKKARDTVKPDGLVALDVGPIGQLLEPTGVLSFEEAYDMYAEIVKAGAAAGADLVVFETMTDLLDVKAAVLAAKENSDLPILSPIILGSSTTTVLVAEHTAPGIYLCGAAGLPSLFNISDNSLMNSGLVPQQPPNILMPYFLKSFMKSANWAAVTL